MQFGIIRQLVSLAEADDLQAEPDLPGVRPTAHKPAICPDASLSAVALMLWHLTCERAKVAVQQQRVHRVSDTVCRVGDAGPMASGQVHVGVGMRAGCGTQRRQHSMHSRCQRVMLTPQQYWLFESAVLQGGFKRFSERTCVGSWFAAVWSLCFWKGP